MDMEPRQEQPADGRGDNGVPPPHDFGHGDGDP